MLRILSYRSLFMSPQFLCDCVARQPDIALAELKTELYQVCAVETSLQTIARSLQQEGYTMKTVRCLPFFPFFLCS
jgi:hypothetical protein